MSTTTSTELLGFPVTITSVPSTIDEAIAACGGGEVGTQKLVSKFAGYSNAHNSFGDAREEIVAQVEKVTKVAQKDDEKDSVYVARALGESGKTVADILASVEVKDSEGNVTSVGVASIESDFNAGGNRRAGGPKTPSKAYVDSATKIIEANKDKPDTLAAIVKGLENLNSPATADRDPNGEVTVDGLAKLLKVNADRKRAEEKAELAALGA